MSICKERKSSDSSCCARQRPVSGGRREREESSQDLPFLLNSCEPSSGQRLYLAKAHAGHVRQQEAATQWEAAETKKSGEAVCMELISFVDVAHHELCLGGVCQQITCASISTAIQYQLPTLSKATGVPPGSREKNEEMAPGE